MKESEEKSNEASLCTLEVCEILKREASKGEEYYTEFDVRL